MTTFATIGFKADVTGLKQAEKGLDNLARKGETSERRINKSVDKVNTNFMTLKSTIGLAGVALTALGSSRIASEIIKQSDAWKNINSQIRQVTNSEEELISVREKLVALSKNTRSELTNTVDLYAQLNRSTKDLGVTEGELLNITKTLNNLFVAGGKPISEVSGAIRQLSQGFAAGALRGDEFNSVAEGAPKIMDALAAKLKMTRGELRAFAATGGITAEIMVNALKDYEQVAQKLADQTTKTFGQAMENATTNITKFVGEAEVLNSAVDGIGSGIEDLSENMDALVDGMQAAATVVGVVMVGAMGKSAFATYNKVAADIAASKSAAAVALAEMNAAKASLHRATQDQLAAKRSLAMSSNDTLRAGAVTRLAAANGALIASTNMASAATARYTAASKIATTSTTALTAATRLLMGPWGLLITAVGAGAIAFANSRDKIDDVNESIKDTNKDLENSVSILQRLQQQTDKMRNADIGTFGQDRLREEIGKSTRLIDLYTERLERLKNAGASFARQTELAEKLRAEKERLEEMNKAMGGAKTGYDLLTKSAQNLIESLDPLTKKQKQLERGTKLLDTALKSGAISTERYNELIGLLGESLKESVDDPFAEMLNALELQRLELTMSADAFEIYQLRMQAMANGLPTEKIDELVEKLKEVQNIRNAKSEGFNMDDLTSQVEDLGGAWSKTGSVIVDAFGDMSDAIDDYSKRMKSLDKIQSNINSKREEEGADIVKLDQLQMQLNDERVSAELSGMRAIASGVGNLFDEKTAAARGFAAIEKAIAVAELAMSVKKIAASATETTAVVANETIKQTSLGTTAIINQAQGDPYTAWARMAAMAAVVAGLGILVSGGSGGSVDMTESRQETQGTGSVFGSDEKSNSILEAQDRYEDIAVDQLAELRGIRSSMGALSNSIALATRTIISTNAMGSFGGSLGTTKTGIGNKFVDDHGLLSALDFTGVVSSIVSSFSKTKKSITDSGISIVSQTLGDIIESGLVDAQAFFDVETKKSSWWGLKKKYSTDTEFQNIGGGFNSQVGAIFQNIGDVVNQSATLLGFDVADALNAFQINLGKISLEGLSGEEIEKELQAVFSQQADLITLKAIPALRDYQKAGEGAFQTLARVTQEQVAFNDAMKMIGNDFGELSSIMKIDMAQSIIDLIGGFEQFSELTSEYFGTFFSESEQFEVLTNSLNEVFDQLSITMPQTRDGFRALIEGLDLTTESGQEMFATLMQLVPGLDAYYSAMKDGQEQAINDAMSALNESISLEKERANVILQASKDAFSAEMSRIETQRNAVLANQSAAEAVLDSAKSALSSAFESRKSGLQAVISSMSALATRLSGAANVNNNDVAGALSKARKGDFSSAQTLSGQLPSANEFSSAAAFRVAQATAKNQLKSIADLASGRASSAQSQIAALDRQYNQLVGINDNTLSLNDAITQYQEAQLALDGLNTDELLNQLSIQEEAAIALLDIAEQNYLDEITRLDLIVENAQAQIDLLNGISENTLTTAQAIEALNAAILQAQTVTVDNPVADPSPVNPAKAEENEALMRQMNKNTKKTAEILQRMELGGLDTRVIA